MALPACPCVTDVAIASIPTVCSVRTNFFFLDLLFALGDTFAVQAGDGRFMRQFQTGMAQAANRQ
jgi:hypothetical protein